MEVSKRAEGNAEANAEPAAGRAARGLILTHGALGEELKRTAELILGHAQGLDTLSNTGLSTAALAARIDRLLAGAPADEPLLVFVDLPGGSCAQACTALLKARPGARLLTGVNLPMIIAFLQYRETMPADELAAGILMRAHRGIAAIPQLAAGGAAEPSGGETEGGGTEGGRTESGGTEGDGRDGG